MRACARACAQSSCNPCCSSADRTGPRNRPRLFEPRPGPQTRHATTPRVLRRLGCPPPWLRAPCRGCGEEGTHEGVARSFMEAMFLTATLNRIFLNWFLDFGAGMPSNPAIEDGPAISDTRVPSRPRRRHPPQSAIPAGCPAWTSRRQTCGPTSSACNHTSSRWPCGPPRW